MDGLNIGAGRILFDIDRKNFDVPFGFTISGDYNDDAKRYDRICVSNSGIGVIPFVRVVDITVTSEGIWIRVGESGSFYPKSDIRQIFYDDKIVVSGTGRYRTESLNYTLYIIVGRPGSKDVAKYMLLDKFQSCYFARYLEQEFEKTLGIRDLPVIHETDYEKKINDRWTVPNSVSFISDDETLKIKSLDESFDWSKPAYSFLLFFFVPVFLNGFSNWPLLLLFFLAAAAFVYLYCFLFIYDKFLLAIEYRTLSLFKCNSAGGKKGVFSCPLLDLDSVYPYEVTSGSDIRDEVFSFKNFNGEKNLYNVFKVKIALKDGRVYNAFNSVDCCTAEFIAEKVGSFAADALSSSLASFS